MLVSLTLAIPVFAAGGPVGWWTFDAGTGTTAADSSGNGNTGTLINSPTWVAGRIGAGALSFNGVKAYVTTPENGTLDNLYKTGLTVSAWIKPVSGANRGRIIDKDNNGNGWFFCMYADNSLQFDVPQFSQTAGYRISSNSIVDNAWQNVIVTWSGSTSSSNIHFYVNGVASDSGTIVNGVGTLGSDAGVPLAIGNRASDLTRGFVGSIDDLRVYNRVLSASEIAALAVGSQPVADTQAPTAPTGVTASAASSSQVNVSWTGSTDNVGVTGYLVERCAGTSCGTFEQIATPTSSPYADGGLSGSTSYSYRLRATDAAGNLSAYSAKVSVTTPAGAGDTQAPTVPLGLKSSGVTASAVTLTWNASSDLPASGGTGVGGYRVYRNGNTATPVATVTTGTSYTDSGLAGSTTYSYQVAAFDKATPANVSAASSALSVTTLSAGSTSWSGGDVGATSPAGSYSTNGGTFTVNGSGADIFGNADAFEFVSQTLSGDGSITARVVSQSNTNAWAKAGVMFRETLSAGSTFSGMFITPGASSALEARTTTGGSASQTAGSGVRAPYWVRIVRAGTLFTGYISGDGKSWITIGKNTISMASQVYVGLAVTSHANGKLGTAVFDNLTVTGTGGTTPTPQISISPTSISLQTGAVQPFTATVTNESNTAVKWEVNSVVGGSATTGTIDTTGHYTTPTKLTVSPTTFTVTVVSSANSSLTASAAVTVSNPAAAGGADVLTYKNDLARTGWNQHETTLTTANVRSSTFGLQHLLPGDGWVYAQPLYVSSLSIAGGTHNVVYTTTEHNSVYAYDADSGAKLWQVSLTRAGETVSDNRDCTQITPEIGVTATPVIDRTAGSHGVIYLVAMTEDSNGGYHQRLHALDLSTGAELFNGPTEIKATYPTLGGGTTTFDPGAYKERTGLLLLNGEIYTTWASHCDDDPYTGWVIAYNSKTLARTRVFNLAPNSNNLGPATWMSGGAPAVDSENNIYLLMANGVFETTLDANGFPNKQDYGNSFVKLSTAGNTLAVADYFTMWNEVSESNADLDLGGSSPMILPDMTDATGVVRQLAVGGGKDGILYLVRRDSMGKFNSSKNNIWQELDSAVASQIRSTPAYFNGTVYYSGRDQGMKAFKLTDAKLSASATSVTPVSFGYPGTVPVVSSNGTSNGIVWAALNTSPGKLYAFDANNLGTELYGSDQASGGRDSFGITNKYTSPMVAGGHVFVATQTGVAVFGLR
jgi:hypothetical protein